MLLNNPLTLYVLSSSDDVCSFNGCCCADNVRRGSDSTMILDRQLSLQNIVYNMTAHSKSNNLSDNEASFSKQNEYSPIYSWSGAA